MNNVQIYLIHVRFCPILWIRRKYIIIQLRSSSDFGRKLIKQKFVKINFQIF